jgi:putative phosphoesterase
VSIVGVISDTHGLLRVEALDALAGSDFIIHAGDIGNITVLERLREIAPVTAVRGNNDAGNWATAIPATTLLEVERMRFYVLHALGDLDRDPRASRFDVVVSGHSHRPAITTRDGRFKLPIAVARVTIRDGVIRPEIIELSIAGKA